MADATSEVRSDAASRPDSPEPLAMEAARGVPVRGPLLRIVPEPRLALAIVLLGLLWLVPGRLGTVAAVGGLGVLAFLMLADALALPGARDLEIIRELPRTIGIGDPVAARYLLSSRWRRDLFLRLAEDLPPAVGGGLGADEVELDLPARGSAQLEIRITGLTRGRFALGPLATRARTRLGLVAARVRWSMDDIVLVAPSISGVSRFRLLALQHRLHEAGVRAPRLRGEGRSFAGLREYALGDDPRHIDWKATARRRKLITREYSVEQSQTVFTLIDAGRSMTQQAGQFSRFEYALSAALVLTDVAASAGDRVGTLVFDTEVRAFVSPQRGQAALRAVRGALVPVAATLAEPDYAAAFRFLAARQRRRALIVFFTDVIDVRASRALLAHVARSASRHLVVVVALRNDAIFSASVPAADHERVLFESAAAEELILARAEALERMRRAGITVLDVSPQTMTAAVVNRYLEIKSRGAL